MPLQIDLITPEKLAFSDQADFVAAPAWDGEIGILPGHTPLLAKLGPGEIRLRKGSDTTFFAVSGGFIEVQRGDRVSIFAETAELAEEIDLERARQAEERAKTKMTGPQSDLTGEELAKVEAALTRARARLRVAEIRRRRAGAQPPIHSDEA